MSGACDIALCTVSSFPFTLRLSFCPGFISLVYRTSCAFETMSCLQPQLLSRVFHTQLGPSPLPCWWQALWWVWGPPFTDSRPAFLPSLLVLPNAQLYPSSSFSVLQFQDFRLGVRPSFQNPALKSFLICDYNRKSYQK